MSADQDKLSRNWHQTSVYDRVQIGFRVFAIILNIATIGMLAKLVDEGAERNYGWFAPAIMTFFVDLAGIFYIVMRPEFKKPFLWAVGCTVEEFFAMLTIALVIIIVGTGGQDATPDRWTRTFTGFQSMVLFLHSGFFWNSLANAFDQFFGRNTQGHGQSHGSRGMPSGGLGYGDQGGMEQTTYYEQGGAGYVPEEGQGMSDEVMREGER